MGQLTLISRSGVLEIAAFFMKLAYSTAQTIDTDLIIEYTCYYMVNKLEITIKKRSG